jgi:hypothetical protein
MAISAAAIWACVPAGAASGFELSRYPAFEKCTTSFDCGVTASEKVPLTVVVVAAP